MRCHLLFALTAVALFFTFPSASDAAPPAEPVVRLTIRPVATTEPALNYKLLPELTDKTPGNCATLYLMASKLGPQDRKQASDLMGEVDAYLDTPLDQLPRDKAEHVLGFYSGRLHLAGLAAHRQEALWDYSLREDGVNALLPQLNDVRGIANLWSLQCRLQILDRDWPAAARTMTNGFSMARQLNRQAVQVQGLVGAGIADEMLERGVRDWIGRGDSPNLYWSLSSLPEPFVDVHEIAVWEKAIPYFTLPLLRERQHAVNDESRWRDFLLQLPALNGQQHGVGNTPDERLQVAMLVAIAYPAAREDLLSSGRTVSQVDAMSVDQVVGMSFAAQFRRFTDDAWKAWELPFWEGRADLQRASDQAASAREQPGGNPILAFVPHFVRARFQFSRLDREIALLRIVEAVRDYAARHDGRPPASLDEIKNLPIPIDPVRGQPFRYEQHGQTVTVEATPYDNRYPADGERYELTITR